MPTLSFICANPSCKKLFFRKSSRVRNEEQYCSMPCYRSRPTIEITVMCQNPTCEKTFTEWPSRIADGHGKHCSKACADRTVEQNFWDKVNKTDTCWLWTAGINDKGYGSFGHGDRNKKSPVIGAHVFSWILHNGSIPKGLCVCHNCPGGDNPSCVNPAHLWLGTKGENTQDAFQKKRMPLGASRSSSKLTEAQVYEIRSLQGTLSAAETSRRFGVSYVTISAIWKRKKWRHLSELPPTSP